MAVVEEMKAAHRVLLEVPFTPSEPYRGYNMRTLHVDLTALAVTENRAVPREVQQFVAIVATGYVLSTLLVNGTTLRFLVRALKLDRLSPADQALRNQVVAIGLGEVRDKHFTPRSARDRNVQQVSDGAREHEQSSDAKRRVGPERDRPRAAAEPRGPPREGHHDIHDVALEPGEDAPVQRDARDQQ